jgi:hypothetical protein
MYRLGRSESAGGFVVKGAMMFLVWHDAPLRVTRDLDLLATRRPTPVLVGRFISTLTYCYCIDWDRRGIMSAREGSRNASKKSISDRTEHRGEGRA